MIQAFTRRGKVDTAADAALQEALRQSGPLPTHIAIIMDGNGRWAQQHGQNRVSGHHKGVESVRDITEACAELEVQYLTLYTFSTENWYRPITEVNALMQLLLMSIQREQDRLIKNNIRLQVLGDLSKLPDAPRRGMEEAIEATRANTGLTLSLALSYSGRWEILQAVRELARRVQAGEIDPEKIDEELFGQSLTTAGMPDPDLLIRTGGEYRVSNFLLWQMAYTEMYITERFWPAFRRKQLYEAIRNFQERDRRFGRVKA